MYHNSIQNQLLVLCSPDSAWRRNEIETHFLSSLLQIHYIIVEDLIDYASGDFKSVSPQLKNDLLLDT